MCAGRHSAVALVQLKVTEEDHRAIESSGLHEALGGIGGMAPSRRKDIARLGLKAVFAASLANFMSAAIAGLFLSLSM